MTKTEQIRITTWPSKVMQHAAAMGNVTRTCWRFGIFSKDVQQMAPAIRRAR